MKKGKMVFSVILMILLMADVTWACFSPGYIRVDNDGDSGKIMETRCYDKDGNALNDWRTRPVNQHTSCKGENVAYVRIKIVGTPA